MVGKFNKIPLETIKTQFKDTSKHFIRKYAIMRYKGHRETIFGF